jgi:2-oxoglutarate dehydrogenase E2 component (dihydrolipoamide succinyltransferase)
LVFFAKKVQIDVSVNAPEAGTIQELLVKEEDTVTVGQEIAKLETGGEPKPKEEKQAKSEPEQPTTKDQETTSQPKGSQETEAPPPKKETPKQEPKLEPPKEEAKAAPPPPPPPPPPKKTDKTDQPKKDKTDESKKPTLWSREERRVSNFSHQTGVI